MRNLPLAVALVLLVSDPAAASAQRPAPRQTRRAPAPSLLEQSKDAIAAELDRRAPFSAMIVDRLFSYGELGFQEVETSRFLVRLLRDSGFAVEEGVAGIPTAWVASWGTGRPVISLGSDIDGLPQTSQYPGIACHQPMVDGAPGHGEGHNSGLAVQITAALAVRAVMQREHLAGTIRIWPGVAEEIVGAKAFYVRAGLFRDVDVALFTHVGSNLSVSWGDQDATGLVSVMFDFEGRSAHAAGAPWRGRSALDAVELMDIAWSFRREHLRLQQRSHYVITQGGDQPNVVPPRATVWYYLREMDEPHIRELFAIADTMARAAALMTGTQLAGVRVVGSAWPQHFNRPLAQAADANARRVGLPAWSDADQTLARAVQREVGSPDSGLSARLDSLHGPVPAEQRRGGGSDDIGDVSWSVPTITLRYPANIPGLPGHSWANGIAMATPIAHKGVTAGAKVIAMTVLDLVTQPALVDSAWGYFRGVQTRNVRYQALIRPEDRPAITMNAEVMERFRPAMRRFYLDPTRGRTYLEQLGIAYPTVRAADGTCPVPAAVPR